MRHGKHIRAAVRSLRSETDAAAAAVAPPPSSARPTGLEISRAGLLGVLARDPAICRSVGLVR